MRYRVFKSYVDGFKPQLTGGDPSLSIEQATDSLHGFDGWNTLTELRDAVRRWAAHALPGDCFPTRTSLVVCVRTRSSDECDECGSDSIDWGDLEPLTENRIQQRSQCGECKRRWVDTFVLADREAIDASKA